MLTLHVDTLSRNRIRVRGYEIIFKDQTLSRQIADERSRNNPSYGTTGQPRCVGVDTVIRHKQGSWYFHSESCRTDCQLTRRRRAHEALDSPNLASLYQCFEKFLESVSNALGRRIKRNKRRIMLSLSLSGAVCVTIACRL